MINRPTCTPGCAGAPFGFVKILLKL